MRILKISELNMENIAFIKTETEIRLGQRRYSVTLLDITTNKQFALNINASDLEYGRLVSILLKLNYSDDKMQAVINNYLLDADDELVLQEFNDMQDYRKRCKLIAKQILDSIK